MFYILESCSHVTRGKYVYDQKNLSYIFLSEATSNTTEPLIQVRTISHHCREFGREFPRDKEIALINIQQVQLISKSSVYLRKDVFEDERSKILGRRSAAK
jgi:hypothetical protein